MWGIAKPLAAANTIELNFGKNPEVSQATALQWVKSLGITEAEITGIMRVNVIVARIIWIKFATTVVYANFLAKFEGDHQVAMKIDGKDRIIQASVYPAGMRERRVTLFGVHLDLSHRELADAMSLFGKSHRRPAPEIPENRDPQRESYHRDRTQNPYTIGPDNGGPASPCKLRWATGYLLCVQESRSPSITMRIEAKQAEGSRKS